jgi:hypothetical protein
MGKRYPNHRRVKIHRSYSVEEIARLLGAHKHTVRELTQLVLSCLVCLTMYIIVRQSVWIVKPILAKLALEWRPVHPGLTNPKLSTDVHRFANEIA